MDDRITGRPQMSTAFLIIHELPVIASNYLRSSHILKRPRRWLRSDFCRKQTNLLPRNLYEHIPVYQLNGNEAAWQIVNMFHTTVLSHVERHICCVSDCQGAIEQAGNLTAGSRPSQCCQPFDERKRLQDFGGSGWGNHLCVYSCVDIIIAAHTTHSESGIIFYFYTDSPLVAEPDKVKHRALNTLSLCDVI